MEEWVTIARIQRARGRSGEVSAVPLSSRPERFSTLQEVVLCGDAGPLFEGRPVGVEQVWHHGQRVIFKFRGVDSIPDAERLRGAEIRIPLGQRPAPPEGEYYHSDLVGCEVVERATGQVLGVVENWRDYGGAGLLEVNRPAGGGELLIPFASSICVEIDPRARRIVVELPEGLKEVNSRGSGAA